MKIILALTLAMAAITAPTSDAMNFGTIVGHDILAITLAIAAITVPTSDAMNFGAIFVRNKKNKKKGGSASAAPPTAAKADASDNKERELLGNCWGDAKPPPAWHPQYSHGWTLGYCRYVIDCNSPTYSTELACCKHAYAGQISGTCISKLPDPPTTSPTKAGGLDVYYPDYNTAWTEATCINDAPLPSGRPSYSSMLSCCKGAYG